MALIPTTQVSVSPDDYKRKMAYALMMQGADASPVQHWAQGLARLGQGALGGYEMYQDDQKQKQDESDATAAYVKMLQGSSSPAAAAPTPAMPTPSTPLPPSSAPMVKADPPAVAGPRPGGPVMPTDKVWGDKEAEAAGLYEPTKNVRMASALAAPEAPPSVPMPAPRPQMAQALAQPSAPPVAAPDPAADKNAKIISLLRGTPAEQKMGRALADATIVQSLKPETTDELKEYNLVVNQAKAAGEKPPSFVEYKTGLKKAGATSVNVDTKGENAFATEAGKSQAKRYNEITEEGQGARQMISDVKTLTELGKTIQTGKLAEAKATIGPYAQALGIDVKGLSEIQAFEAIVNRVAPSLRVKGSGAQSDFELKNFLKSLPSLGNTPEGNAIAAQTMEGLQQNKIAASEIASKALAREITPAQADKMLRELPDPMEGYREYLKKTGGSGTKPNVDALKKKYGLQ